MGRKILLVDDSRTALFMESMILKKGPWEIVTAQDGEEAVEKAVRMRPDLILMDVVMPRRDGLAACQILRTLEATRTVPIILVTTRGDEQHVTRGFESGCNDYVTKPINSLELLAKVRSHLGETA